MIPQTNSESLWRKDIGIFFISALILYLELVLIRWMGTEIRIFAYLGNLILVICFFGSGLGCYHASKPASMAKLGINLLLLVTLVANPFHQALLNVGNKIEVLCLFTDSPFWVMVEGGSLWGIVKGFLVLAAILYLVVFTFLPLGQLLGKSFQDHPKIIRAYSVNIAGSLAGIWLFNTLSFISSPPAAWFAVLVILLAVALITLNQKALLPVVLSVLAVISVWAGAHTGIRTIWTPYQRITVQPFYADTEKNYGQVQEGYVLDVNNVFYQHMLDLSDGFVQKNAALLNPEWVAHSHYNLPFHFKPVIQRMLIVGAGSGNDAAAALRHNVGHVDAVEIDPRIYALGKELHPEHPYDSPRVHAEIDDARAYFKRAKGPYDMIWFGWLDSHTLGSSYSNLRLDHYVYTRESLQEAKKLLSEDGILVLSFAAERRWIADRLFGLARDVFGHEPLAYEVTSTEIPQKSGGGGNLTLICSRKPIDINSIADPDIKKFVESHRMHLAGTTRPTTDDWPYLYLQYAKIPRLHLLITLIILATVAMAWRRALGISAGGFDRHFFALGAAFLLLEVQTISRATLLFGMTWKVNAIVISAILIMILAANFTAVKWRAVPFGFIVAGLFAALLSLAVIPLDWFNGLQPAAKLAASGVFLTLPLFFSGLIFARSFEACADKSAALGSNLIGALVGGLLETVSYATGVRALILGVAVFYLIAVTSAPHKKTAS